MTYITQVINSTTTTPPGSPTQGDSYIIGSGATGAWSGHDDELATWIGDDWLISAPNDGELAWDADLAAVLAWNQSLWVRMGTQAPDASYAGQTISNPPTQAEMQTLDDALVALCAALRSSGLMAEP